MLTVRAPGRVNLIGDHTDYQGGLCLPMAIDREVVVRAEPRTDGRVVVRSDAFDATVDVPAAGLEDPSAVTPSWGRTVAAVLHVLGERGWPATGFDADVRTTIPVGSGLSSSAAFEVAIAYAACAIAGHDVPKHALALAAQSAEELASGVPCGVMDQMASVFGVAGHALVLDCSELRVTPIPIPPDVGIVVVHSGLPRRLEDSAYSQRRAACEAAAARYGVGMLADLGPAAVLDDPFAQHVVDETWRVAQFVRAFEARDLAESGRLMIASHASLRDKFRVSTPELDTLVELLVASGAYGARLTGAGFGGCVVALADAARAAHLAADAASRYRAATGLEPMPFVVRAVDGAGMVTPTERD